MQFTDEHKALASNVKNFLKMRLNHLLRIGKKMVIFSAHDLFRKWKFRLSWHNKKHRIWWIRIRLQLWYGFAEALGYAADLGVITAIGVQTDMATPACRLDLTN